MPTFVFAITGASGAPYARRALEELMSLGHDVALIVSPAGQRVMEIETGFRATGGQSAREAAWRDLLGASYKPGALSLMRVGDIAAPVASGSFQAAGMAVAPCSMGTLARIATGASTNLIERAADVMIKERRKLVLVPREAPLSEIHLRNMLAVTRAGAEILPASPGFYHGPRTIDDLVDFVAGRILDRLGVENSLMRRWQGAPVVEMASLDD
jgi:4-hydroxy-3-polyprenylbenzoate decarboxylase